jgi:hypothetical protein
MYCLTPDLTVCNNTKKPSGNNMSNPNSDDDVQFRLTILGFVLDGDDNYDDLKKHKDLPSQVSAYRPPVIPMADETVQYKQGLLLEIKVQQYGMIPVAYYCWYDYQN